MKIAFEIDDELSPSFEQYIGAYYPTLTVTLDEFVILHVQTLVERVVEAFPPASMAADRDQIRVLQQQLKDRLKPTKEPRAPRP